MPERTQQDTDMRRARDPALFLSIYLDKHHTTAGPDPREGVLREVDRFVEKYKLTIDTTPVPLRGAAGIDLDNLGSSPGEYRLLFRAQTPLRRPPAGTFCQCLAYEYSDALVVQFAISRFSDWQGALTTGWNELVSELHAGFDGGALDTAQDMIFGVSAVFWVIADDAEDPKEYSDEVRVLAGNQRLLRTSTDLGPLWHCNLSPFSSAEAVSQDLWMLVTTRNAEEEVNKRYHRPRLLYPPDFAVVALANHKIKFEWHQYLALRSKLEHLHRVLDERANQILEVQARLGSELDELRSEKGMDFQRKLARATNRLASYSSHVSQARELRRTLLINRRNYLTNCIALISSPVTSQVARSRSQEDAAAKFLDSCPEEEIFGTNLGHIHGICNQLDSDLDYADSLIERHTTSLRSATDQLRIAGERVLGEIAHHISIDSAAVVASVAAILIVELVVKPSLEPASRVPPLANVWELALAGVIGSFAITQVLSSGCRGKGLERHSLALASGFFGAWAGHFLGAWLAPFLGTWLVPLATGRACRVYDWIWQAMVFVGALVAVEYLHPQLSRWLEHRRRCDFHQHHADTH